MMELLQSPLRDPEFGKFPIHLPQVVFPEQFAVDGGPYVQFDTFFDRKPDGFRTLSEMAGSGLPQI